MRTEIVTLEGRLAAQRRAAASRATEADGLDRQRHNEHMKILQALDYPWNRVFSTLEQANVDNLAVLSFSHEANTGRTRITIESSDVATLVRFVDKLNGEEGEGTPGNWYLASYQLQPQNTLPTVIGVVLEKH